VDIVFTRCKAPGHKRLALKEFLNALAALADEAGKEFGEVRDALLSSLSDEGAGQESAGVAVRDITSSLGGGSIGSPTGSLTRAKGPQRGGSGSGAGRDGLPQPIHDALSTGGAMGSLYRGLIASGAKQAAVIAGEEEQGDGEKIGTAMDTGEGSPPSGALKTNPLFDGRAAATARAASPPRDASGALAAVLARLDTLEAAGARRQRQLDGVSVQQAQLAAELQRVASRAEGGSPNATLRKLAAQLASLDKAVEELKGGGSKGGAGDDAAIGRIERKMAERQSRVESALMQVARQVDVLDARLREEQETSLKALEAILAGSASSPAHKS